MKFLWYWVSNILKYNFRSFVLNSSVIQCILLLAAPFRKKSSNPDFQEFVWVGYLTCDYASNFGVGLIPTTNAAGDEASQVLLLWAPFLLLQFGRLDSITAFTSTDNELWSRYAIQLATIVYAILNAYNRSFTSSPLKLPFLLIFVAGFSRFVERILCLSQARSSSLQEALLKQPSKKPLQIYEAEEEEEAISRHSNSLSDADILRNAYRLFGSFKPLFVGLHVESSDRRKSREHFRGMSASNAFTIVEIELNFAYDMFYTKAAIMRQWLGRVLHPISIVCEVLALAIWLRTDKGKFNHLDVIATNFLFVAALARDFVSICMAVFSDWTLASVARKPRSAGSKLVGVFLSLRKRRWGEYLREGEAPFFIIRLRSFFRRWSETISQLNLIDEVYRNSYGARYKLQRIEKAIRAIGLDYVLIKVWHGDQMWFNDSLRDFIFLELKDNVDVGATRGQLALENYMLLSNNWITTKSFDESLIVWHVATSLCYYTEEDETLKENRYSDLSMTLSEYMMFLLHNRPDMMVEVAAMGEMRFDATQIKAKSYFSAAGGRRHHSDSVFVKSACQNLLQSESSDGEHEGYSVLYQACRLAKELKDLNERGVIEMWEVVAKVWAEMLSYAAVRCSPSAHVAELANGGQLLTVVWMLIHHYDLAN